MRPEDVQASELHVRPEIEYRDNKRRILGTQVGRNVSVILRDLSMYGSLIQGVMNSEPDSILTGKLTSSDASARIDEAQLNALADARARAARLAEAAGRRLGAVYSISEFNVRKRESTHLQPARGMIADGSIRALATDADLRVGQSNAEIFEPGEIHATATVYVVYLLK